MITISHKALHKQGKALIVDVDFAPLAKRFLDKAFDLGILVYITNSFRKKEDHLSGTIVDPAKASNHYIGHAFDCNLQVDKVFYNSAKLEVPSGKVLELILFAESNGMRWGGRFQRKDVVHFDDGINIRQPMMWKQKYNLIHQ